MKPMKKLLAISLVVAGTLAAAGSASALDRVFLSDYPGWAQQALSGPSR
jgi:hypothetical protein